MGVKFRNYYHRRNFTEYMSPRNPEYHSLRSELIAAVFLLSADKCLWKRSRSAVNRYAVNFDRIDLNGISTEGYALYKAAKMVYNGKSDLYLSEFCDWTLLDDPTTLTIFAGVMLRRNGVKMLNWRY